MVTVGVHQLLNTLYVMTDGAYAHVDHDSVLVEAGGETKLRAPKRQLGAIVCFGNVAVSSGLIQQCSMDGRALVFMDRSGRFRARIVGPTTGNVLLRQAQHSALDDRDRTLAIAVSVAAGKIKNSRVILMRGAREAVNADAEAMLRSAVDRCDRALRRLRNAGSLDEVRGQEGDVANGYFQVFQHLVRENTEVFQFSGRNRRPPRDPVNALLSFLYALLTTDCVAALEGVGLDPQVGYLHAIRPGRPALALDLLEELRSPVADRLTLTLINRRQISGGDFESGPGGAVTLNDAGRRKVAVAYQKRKSEEVRHLLLDRMVPVGLVPHVQARLLARHLRADLEHYVPYTTR